MKNCILLSEKERHLPMFRELSSELNEFKWKHLRSKEEFTLETLQEFNPDYIFIPHWSYLIPSEIYNGFNCVIFHMTDLPYGRGGSPLQNLILRGHTTTVLSAIRAEKGLDSGPIYLKKPLSLQGTAEEIFQRTDVLIKEMISEISLRDPTPVQQEGEITVFKRRTPEESDLSGLSDPEKLYDFIRMLDAPDYPKAFLDTENFRLEFTKASLENGKLNAHVSFIKK
jgi:methionyl-tRNA formyltransferase